VPADTGAARAAADDAPRARAEVLNGIHSNAAGLRRWLDQAGRAAPASGGS